MINTTISTQPFLMIGDVYEKMKQKCQNKVRYTTYFEILFNTLLEMFEWKNLPDTIPKRFLEAILHAEGEVFVSEINGDLIASGGTLSGEVDAYGLGTDCIAVCPIGEARGKRNIDIAYGVNNDTGTPDMLLYWIAHLLGETDKSINLNIIYSRFLKIPKVGNDKDKSMFEEIIKKVLDGEPQAFCSKNALDIEFGAGAECFELTDVNKIDKLPYLTQFFEDALKRFYNFYGQPMQNQNKRAQSISDEIHGQDSVSFILPSQMLKCRQALADNINHIFGTDISVDFSDLWKLEYEALVVRDTNGNGIADTTEGADMIEGTATTEGVATTDTTNPEPTETETEPAGTLSEPTETETEPAGTVTEPTDTPAMELEGGRSEEEAADSETSGNGEAGEASETSEASETRENGSDGETSGNDVDGEENVYYNIEEIAQALDVSVDEIRQLIRG